MTETIQSLPVTEATGRSKSRVRTCVGCGSHEAPEALVRVVHGDFDAADVDGAVAGLAIDPAGGTFGRGAHVHARPECLVKACRGGFSRSFRGKIEADAKQLAAAIARAYDRRMSGLLVGARRAGYLAVGADVALEALDAGAALAVVACDAGAIVTKDPIVAAIAEGRVVVWSTKLALGALLGRDEIALIAVKIASVAEQFKRGLSAADAVRGL